MKLNLKWLWIVWKQSKTYQDFPTWVIQNHRVNEQVFIKNKKPEIFEYHLPKEVMDEVLDKNYSFNNEEYFMGDLYERIR